jgi:hypothetical protein
VIPSEIIRLLAKNKAISPFIRHILTTPLRRRISVAPASAFVPGRTGVVELS